MDGLIVGYFYSTRNQRLLVFLLALAPKGTKNSLALTRLAYLTTFAAETK